MKTAFKPAPDVFALKPSIALSNRSQPESTSFPLLVSVHHFLCRNLRQAQGKPKIPILTVINGN